MICKICDHVSDYAFTKTLLNKYEIKYYRCPNCLFIQTEEPYWLNESYADAITSLDIGLVYRNLNLLPPVQSIIIKYFDIEKRFLDFGGGYGLFVRMMRDKGYNFYRQDKFCENLFAKEFDVENIDDKNNFELITSFELFEHLSDPIQGIKEMLQHGKSVMFSTELSPNQDISSWWYIMPEIGQHVSLYHYKSLIQIAKRFNLNLYSNMSNIHLLTPKKISPWIFRQLCRPKISYIFSSVLSPKSSFLQKDFEYLKTLAK